MFEPGEEEKQQRKLPARRGKGNSESGNSSRGRRPLNARANERERNVAEGAKRINSSFFFFFLLLSSSFSCFFLILASSFFFFEASMDR
jgi:hypothetical protein